MDFDLENALKIFQDLHSDTEMHSFFFNENDHMPSQNYLSKLKTNAFDLTTMRRETIALIFMNSYNLDPLISYFAVNYLDRYLSNQDIPQGKLWILRLLAFTCVSLSAKMMKTEHSVFQCEEGFVFDTQTIERMEMQVLGALKWRMRSITPFSFVQFFVSSLRLKDHQFTQALRDRAIEIIFKSQNLIEILEFKPSIIAASALLLASNELFPMQFSCISDAISNDPYVTKENLWKCYSTMEYKENTGYETVLINMNSSSSTPVNVLDWNYSSSESQKTTITTTTPASASISK